jgi:hypothetical protein
LHQTLHLSLQFYTIVQFCLNKTTFYRYAVHNLFS